MKNGRPPSVFRDFLIAEALRRELTPEDISRICGGRPTAEHIHSYMTHRGAMGEDKLDRIFKALNLRIQNDMSQGTHGLHASPVMLISVLASHDNKYATLELTGEDFGLAIKNLSPGQLRQIATSCNAAAGLIDGTIEPEANVSLLAIGEPNEVDENAVVVSDDIPF